MDTSPQLLSANSESLKLSPNVLSPHIDASLLLRRRSSFQFKFLSKVSELRDAIRHAVTFEKSSPNATAVPKSSEHNPHENGRRSSVTLKIDKGVEAFPCEKDNVISSKAYNYVDKWTQTEEKYFRVSSFHPVTPVRVSKKKIVVSKSPVNSMKDRHRQHKIMKSRQFKDTSSFEEHSATEILDASFFAEDGIVSEKYIFIDENTINDSVKSFLENERRAAEASQNASFPGIEEREMSNKRLPSHTDDEANIAGEIDVVVTTRTNVSIDKFMSSIAINSPKGSEEDSLTGDYSLYCTDYPNTPEHIFEQSLKIYSPLCNKPKHTTSSPKLQDSGYDYLSSSVFSDEGKLVFDNSLDLEAELPNKRMMTVPEEKVLNETYEL